MAESSPGSVELSIDLAEAVDGPARSFLEQQIKRFNDETSPHHRAIRPVGTRPLGVLVHNAAGELIGGLVGDTYWGWLEIDELWLPRALRGQGIGRKLMQMAETEAQARGCRRALVSTFSAARAPENPTEIIYGVCP